MARASYWLGRALLVGQFEGTTGLGIGQKDDMLWAITSCCSDTMGWNSEAWRCKNCNIAYHLVPENVMISAYRVKYEIFSVSSMRDWVAGITGIDVDRIELSIKEPGIV